MIKRHTMPKEAKAKWLKALRGGRYRQGKGILYSPLDKTYCCLGVMQRCMTKKVEASENADGYFDAHLPFPTLEWIEKHNIKFYDASNSPTSNPVFNINGLQWSASELNDREVYSFKQIADIIEEQVDGV